jgi:hydroxymethylbilane synthase
MEQQNKPLIRIGTRGSQLALIQANDVADKLRAAHAELREEGAVEIVVIRTTGDVVRDRPLAEIGGKGLFIKEIEEALFDCRIDIAVHSMKDVETELAPDSEIVCILPREDPRDAFICKGANRIDDLPQGAVLGTASVRRRAFALNRRPDLKVVLFRGNVDTRLRKLEDGEADATLLALSGLRRMGLEDRAAGILEPEEMLPAAAQGAVGVQCRLAGDNEQDTQIRAWLRALNHTESEQRVIAERAVLAVLDGSCRTPIGALAEIDGDEMHLRGCVCDLDGREMHMANASGPVSQAAEIGQKVGTELLALAGPDFRV